jgi:hypothetical protein
MVRLSVQNPLYTDYNGRSDCLRREFCTYGDVVCAIGTFTLGDI